MFSLFRKSKPPQIITTVPKIERTSYAMEHIKAPLDVMDENNKKLCSCRLKSYTQYSVILEHLPGELSLPILEERTNVCVRGYTNDLKSLDLQGIVGKSTRTELQVNRIKHRDYDDLRASFRQPVYAPAEIYKSKDINRNQPEPCQLLNISTGGACVQADKKYNIEDDIVLRVELYPGAGPISFKGRIIRVQKKPDESFEYGIIFAQLTAQKKHDLEHDTEELRRIMQAKTYK